MMLAHERDVLATVVAPGVPPASLARVEAFQFPEAVYKFVDYYDVAEGDAELIFAEVKKWLWLAAMSMYDRSRGKPAPDLLITGSLFWLDEMWHTFVLFTEPYHDFCRDYLGRFIHHRPTTRAEKMERREQLMQESTDTLRNRADSLRRQCEYIYDHLGEETVVRWYREYPSRYSAENLFAKVKMRQPVF